jgi:hypothetical protein
MSEPVELIVRTKGLAVEAGLNDAPLVRSDGREPISRSLAIDLWILPEDNRLTVRVSPGEEAAERPFLDLAIGSRAQPEPLCRVRWSSTSPSFEPFSIEIPIVLDSDLARTDLWRRKAPPLTPDDTSAAQELGWRFHEIVQRRDATALASLVAYRTDETARAFQLDAARLRESVREQFEETFASPGLRVSELAQDSIRVTPCAGDRVFHLSRADGGELMEVSHDRGDERGQVYVARVDGCWTIVR